MATRDGLASKAIESRILSMRGENVILDADLAVLYGVSTKALNQAVSRNAKRFPLDFRFRLTSRERREVVTNCDRLSRLRFSAVLPWAFNEHGAIMAATVLKSPRAVEMSLFIVRAFVRLRNFTRSHGEFAEKLDALERKVAGHDGDLKALFTALRTLLSPPRPTGRRIGFGAEQG